MNYRVRMEKTHTFLGIFCVSKNTTIKKREGETRDRESPKILFLVEEDVGREGNLGANPTYQYLRKKGQVWNITRITSQKPAGSEDRWNLPDPESLRSKTVS